MDRQIITMWNIFRKTRVNKVKNEIAVELKVLDRYVNLTSLASSNVIQRQTVIANNILRKLEGKGIKRTPLFKVVARKFIFEPNKTVVLNDRPTYSSLYFSLRKFEETRV